MRRIYLIICTLQLPSTEEGGVRVCGDVVLRYFWCGFAVIFILSRGIAFSKHYAVCGYYNLYSAVFGEKSDCGDNTLQDL